MGINDGLKTSQNGLEFIAKWEGCILHPYKDVAGYRTIGVGHLIKPGENFPDGVPITKEKALEILANDVKACEDSLKLRINVPLNQNQFDAMISFGFNCGTGMYILSDVCKSLNQGNYKDVPTLLLNWSKTRINGVLTFNQGLYNRRKSEGELFAKDPNAIVVPMVQWTKQSLTEAQTKLSSLNLYKAKVDGLWGPSTSSAIAQFAFNKGIPLGSNPQVEVPQSLLDALKSS